jgi:acyl-CoA thioesterase-1
MSMKNVWIVSLAALVACSSERNMDSGSDTRGTAPTSSPIVNAAAAVTRRPDSAATTVRVLFFGTSLTAGLGLDPSQAFPVLVAKKAAAEGLPITAVNAGLSGETSAGALRRIDWALEQGGPFDVVVLETGGNDALRALDPKALESNVRAVVERIKKDEPLAKIVLAVMEAPPNLGAQYTTQFREAYKSVAKSENLILMPFLLDRVAGKADLNQDDGVHPNVAGEKIVADNVWRTLKPVVEGVRR